MNVIAKGFIGATMVAAFGLSHASGPIYYTVNGGSTEQLHITSITDTFEGTTRLSSGFFCQVDCTLTVDGEMADDLTGDTTLTVTNASVSGSSSLCGLLSLSGFPWEGSVPHSSIPSPLTPVTFTMDNVAVSASLCGSCSGQIDVTFDPDNGGSFEFDGPITPNGNCNVRGSLTSANGNYYDAWH
ncbi:MAG: hypothetical protein LAT61_09445 [Alcanivorax sp.]|nr:hypothetical protein [Alcanivorax sp.]